jgi:hypothetical protein
VYHPEAIMLDVKPKRVLASIHDAVRAATMTVIGRHDTDGTPPRWIPHITICYSTAGRPWHPSSRLSGRSHDNARFGSARSAWSSSTVPKGSGTGRRSEPSTSQSQPERKPDVPGFIYQDLAAIEDHGADHASHPTTARGGRRTCHSSLNDI